MGISFKSEVNGVEKLCIVFGSLEGSLEGEESRVEGKGGRRGEERGLVSPSLCLNVLKIK